MANQTPTLLCESCGYTIAGLPESASCSECGRPVASSLPEARAGSPWQQRPGLRSLLRTAWITTSRPLSLFRAVRIQPRGAASLLAVYLLLSSLILVAPWSGTLVDDPIRSARAGHTAKLLLIAGVTIPLQVLSVAALLLLLTLIEWAGIQFYTNRKGGRLTRAAAWQICAHASIGWVISAAALWLGLIIWLNLSYFGLTSGHGRELSNWLPVITVGAAALAGLLAFEFLVYAGVRCCRFSNPSRVSPRHGLPPPPA